jgi:hypothetical protein
MQRMDYLIQGASYTLSLVFGGAIYQYFVEKIRQRRDVLFSVAKTFSDSRPILKNTGQIAGGKEGEFNTWSYDQFVRIWVAYGQYAAYTFKRTSGPLDRCGKRISSEPYGISDLRGYVLNQRRHKKLIDKLIEKARFLKAIESVLRLDLLTLARASARTRYKAGVPVFTISLVGILIYCPSILLQNDYLRWMLVLCELFLCLATFFIHYSLKIKDKLELEAVNEYALE